MKTRNLSLSALTLALAALLPTGAFAQAAEFVGPETCKACHPQAHEAWQRSTHARSTRSLTDKQLQQPSCTACHAPQQSRGDRSVSCESCHGAGSLYAKSHVMKDKELSRLVGLQMPTEKTCAQCHDAHAPSLTRFNFVERKARIDHGDKAASTNAGTRADAR